MIKKFIQIIVLVLILILLPTVNTFASGKLEARIGEKVILQGLNVQSGSHYKWVIKKGSDIIDIQTNPMFNYSFIEQGEYNVNLVQTDSLNNIKTTSILVLVGDKYTSIVGKDRLNSNILNVPFTVELQTLPELQSDSTVHVLGDGKVIFDIGVTRSDVIEYRIDKNIFVDSDGNGVANDDIDNSGDDSYLLGGMWHAQYDLSDLDKIVSEITLVTSSGEKAKKQVEMIFDSPVRSTGDPVAILDIVPYPDSSDQLVHLYNDEEEVGFYLKHSEGKILEYRIDKNIFVDSDSDGNPANDIDNINDISFKTGDGWMTTYKKSDQQIIAQLIVVGEGGKGSKVQRGLWFTDKPKPKFDLVETSGGVYLSADKDFVLKGDPITFTVDGLPGSPEEYTYEWDFDGDDIVDKTTEGINEVIHIYEIADIYDVKVVIKDLDGNSVDAILTILSKDVVSTISDFDFVIDGNTVTFTNKSVPALNLANKNLSYNWSFGDTEVESYEKQKDQIGLENPKYTYNKAGTYIVSLTVKDSEDITHTKTAEIIIGADLEIVDEISEPMSSTVIKDNKESGSIIVKLLKIVLYLILIVIILALLIFGGFLVFLKVQHPDLTLEELIDELKIKLLGMMGVHDMIEEIPVDDPVGTPMREESQPAPSAILSETSEPESEPKVMPQQESGPTPDWLKTPEPITPAPEPKLDVIEGEVVEPTLEPLPEQELTPTNRSSIPEPTLVPEPTPAPSPSSLNPTSTPEPTPAPIPTTSSKSVEVEPTHKPEEADSHSGIGHSSPKANIPSTGGKTPQAETLNKQDGPVPDWLKGA